MSDELLTTPQAAYILKKGARTVQRMADDGKLAFVQKLPGPNGAYLFSKKLIDSMAPKAEQVEA